MKKHARAAIVVMLALAFIVPAHAANAVISGTDGAVTKILPPTSVAHTNSALWSTTTTYAFDEQQGVTLSSGLRVDITAPGDYESNASLTTGTIPAGTVVDSHYFTSARPTGSGASTLTGTLSFPTDILGIIVSRGKLVSSNILGAPSTDYTITSLTNDLELSPTGDGVNMTNLRTVTIRANTDTDLDQVRIITRHDAAPVPVAGGPYTTVEQQSVTLHGTVTDAESDPIQTSWTFDTTGKPGTVCTPTNTTTLTPTITCNDDAVVTATLSATDPYHAPVTSTAQITVNNVAPVLGALTAPTDPVALADSVAVSANFTDVGPNDTHVANVMWGDTTSSAGNVTESGGNGSVAASHTYSSPGIYTITVALTDDDGGVSTQTTQVDVNGPPTANAGGPYTGSEGTAAGLVGNAVDPENDPLTTSWTFTPTSSDPGTVCTPAATSTLAPTITCNDDAVVSAQLSASDGINDPAVSSTIVTINDVAPVLGTVTTTSGPIPLGGTVNVDAPFTDAGANDTHTATVNWGDLDTTNATVTEANGVGTLHSQHAYTQPGLYTVTVTVTDDNGLSDTSTVQVLVNTPPTVSAGGPYVGFEGSQMALAGTATDVDGDHLTYSWGFTWTGDAGTTCTAAGADTLTPTLICNDDAVVTATLTVSDGVNAPVQQTATITVGNVAPSAGTLVPSATLVPTGDTLSVAQAFSDAGTNDTHTAVVDWGDTTSTAASVNETAGAGTLSGTHAYGHAGTYTITVTLADDNGGSTISSTQVVVNTPPTASAGGPYHAVEGTPITLSGTAHDADGDPLSTSWGITWTGDPGTGCQLTDDTTLTPTIVCNDDAAVTATLTVGDGVNAPVTDTASVTVANAAPDVAALTLPTSPTAVGDPVAVSTTFTDAGANDTHTATVSWGDSTITSGTVTELAGSGSVAATHNYATHGTFHVSVTVADDNGGTATSTGTVVVNGAPTVGAGGPYAGNEGSNITLSGTAADPDSDSLSVAWTDNITSSDSGTTCSFTGTNTLTPTLNCNDDATVSVTATVSDGITAPASDTSTVTVQNVAPSVGAVNPSANPIPTGGSVSISAPFTDAGGNDTHVASIDWGDTTSSSGTVVESGGAGTVSGSHTYAAAGTYHVVVTVMDDNGGASTSTVDVQVDGAPTVNAAGPYTGVEGAPVTLGANATDPDHDPLSITWTSHVVTAGAGTVCTFTNIHTLAPSLTCNDDAVVQVTISVSDGVNPAVSDTTTVTVLNAPPSVSTPHATPNPAPTGASVALTTAFADAGVNDTHLATINWGDGNTTSGTVNETNGSGTVTGSHAYATAGSFIVTVTVNDKDGGVSSATAQVVVNAKPVASAGGPYSGVEGSPVTLHGTATDADHDTLGTAWSITYTGDPGTACTLTGSATLSPAVTCTDDASVSATLSVTDGVNAPVTSTATVQIANVAPAVTSLSVPTSPVAVGTSFTMSAGFTDAGTNDTHTASVNWGDSSTSTGTVSEHTGTGTVTASHAYTATGTFFITVTVTDDDTGAASATSTTAVTVFNASANTAGLITGAGVFKSPSNAYTPNNSSDHDYRGDATFAFLALNLSSSGNPTGATAFNLSSAGLDFDSVGVSTLSVTNSGTKGVYTGTGYVNGVGGYSVLVSVVDGGWFSADKIRVKIWNTSSGAVLYDNQNGAVDSASATQSISVGAIIVLG